MKFVRLRMSRFPFFVQARHQLRCRSWKQDQMNKYQLRPFLLVATTTLPFGLPLSSPSSPILFSDCEMFATFLSIALFAFPVIQGVHAEFFVATPKSLTAVRNIPNIKWFPAHSSFNTVSTSHFHLGKDQGALLFVHCPILTTMRRHPVSNNH